MAESPRSDVIQRKPARIQLNPSLVAENSKPEQTGEVFNIWYSKWTGGENNGKIPRSHSKHRCNVELDSGYTKADKYIEDGKINRSQYFCLYFARGYCCNGKSCQYLHRVPTQNDVFPTTVDCFGREKFSDYRDDMTGIGSFEVVNKTLFVSNISTINSSTEAMIRSSFGEFGNVVNVKVLPNRNSAFVSFRLENQAQFAKEAMQCQSLEASNKSETLHIRWSKSVQSQSSLENQETKVLSIEVAKRMLDSLSQHQANKRFKTNNGEVKVNEVNNSQVLPENTGLDMETISKLGQSRKNENQPTINLIPGYSSDDDSE